MYHGALAWPTSNLESASETNFIEAYGPVVAAAIALVGVVLTLLVTSFRDRRLKQLEREDAYRAEVRSSLASLLTTAKNFERYGRVMGDPARWVLSGYEQATTLADSTERTMSELQQRLVTSLLLNIDTTLQHDLEVLMKQVDRVSEVVHEANDAFWEARRPSEVILEASARWDDFGDACEQLMEDGRRLLMPTHRQHQRTTPTIWVRLSLATVRLLKRWESPDAQPRSRDNTP